MVVFTSIALKTGCDWLLERGGPAQEVIQTYIPIPVPTNTIPKPSTTPPSFFLIYQLYQLADGTNHQQHTAIAENQCFGSAYTL